MDQSTFAWQVLFQGRWMHWTFADNSAEAVARMRQWADYRLALPVFNCGDRFPSLALGYR